MYSSTHWWTVTLKGGQALPWAAPGEPSIPPAPQKQVQRADHHHTLSFQLSLNIKRYTGLQMYIWYNPPPTGDLPLSEDPDVSKPNRGFEGTAASAAVLDDVNSGVHPSCPSLQHSCTFTSFRPTVVSIATSSDCQETREGDKAGPLSLQEAPSGTNEEPHAWSHTFTCPSRDTQGHLKVV